MGKNILCHRMVNTSTTSSISAMNIGGCIRWSYKSTPSTVPHFWKTWIRLPQNLGLQSKGPEQLLRLCQLLVFPWDMYCRESYTFISYLLQDIVLLLCIGKYDCMLSASLDITQWNGCLAKWEQLLCLQGQGDCFYLQYAELKHSFEGRTTNSEPSRQPCIATHPIS